MSPELERLIKAFSRLLGWIYTLCWSASFYPQFIDNFRRRSTTGLAIDYPTANVVGFACYTIYTTTFLYSPVIRQQYALRHPLSVEPTVRFNDFAFSVHALIITALAYTQYFPWIWGLTVSRHQTASKTMKGIMLGCVVLVGSVICIVLGANPNGGYDPGTWAWIDVIYTISYLKLFITIIKYIPQAWLNFKRKSTENWRIENILLDLAGGVLSLAQLFIDSSFNDDWSGLTGNPAKLLLSNISILFDILFMLQHYVLYTNPSKKQNVQEDAQEESSVVTPLLAESHTGYSSLDDANARV